MAKSIYRRLTSRARSLTGYTQLWIADDHLLQLRSTHFHEHYQRFAFADIQAVMVTELPARTPLQAALAAAALLWLLCFLLVTSAFAKYFFIITGGIALAAALVDIILGPRCRCYLHTAVSRELLTPIKRMNTARIVLEKLQPAIEAVQGAIPSEQLAGFDDRTSAHAGGMSGTPPEIVSAPGYLPEITFALFLVNAAAIFLDLYIRNEQLTGLLLTTLFGELLLVVVSLVRRGTRDPRRYLYVVLVVSLLGIGWDAFYFIQTITGWFSGIVDAASHGVPTRPPQLLSLFERNHGLLSSAWRVVAGSIGLAAAYFERMGLRPSHHTAPQEVTVPEQ